MKIAFIDFEFGQIYGSWRRDFLVTQGAVLIYDTLTEELHMGEKIYKPDIDLVMRKKIKNSSQKWKLQEEVIHYASGTQYVYDKKFKIPSKKRTELRKYWGKSYAKSLRRFLNNSLKDVDTVCLFGGKEDKQILQRYCNLYLNIEDIQDYLESAYDTLYSLDRVIELLRLENHIEEEKISSINYQYNLPKKISKNIKYNRTNLTPHNASGDCIRLFVVYKELF